MTEQWLPWISQSPPSLPTWAWPPGKTQFCALCLGEVGTIKLLSGQAVPVFEQLLQLGPLSSTLRFLLCLLASLEAHPLRLLVPTAMRLRCYMDLQWDISLGTLILSQNPMGLVLGGPCRNQLVSSPCLHGR